MKKTRKKQPASSDAREPRSKKKTSPQEPKTEETHLDQDSLGNDYWERVAEDPASGYKNKKDGDRLLNMDQEPDDHQRGDKED